MLLQLMSIKTARKAEAFLAALLSAVLCISILSGCGQDSGKLSHSNQSLSVEESSQIKGVAKEYFKNIYMGDGQKALSLGSHECLEDSSVKAKYATGSTLMRFTKNRTEDFNKITNGIDEGKVAKGRDGRTAVLTTPVVMDLGFIKEGDTWKVDYKTVKSIVEGGYIKE